MIGYLTQNHPLIQAFAQRSPARRSRREALAVSRIFKLAVKLTDCFPDDEVLAVKGTMDRPISGLATDSRRVFPGTLFFALPGIRTDGTAFIDEAVSRGAVAVVVPKIPAHPPGKATFIQVADVRAAMARASQRYYRFPDRDMTVIGVTGSYGKTTVAHLLKHLLSGDQRVGLLGGISYDLGGRTVPSFRTTPEAVDLHGMMAQMRDAGCRHAVLEVSSQGIEQQSVRGVRFGAAVFTNVTPEQFELKSGLFTGGLGEAPKISVVNLDDAHGETLAARITALGERGAAVRVVTYGENPAAQVRAERISCNLGRTTFRLVWPGGELDLESPLVGRGNVSNLLAAVATAWGLGRDPVVVLARLRAFAGVPGRMERVEAGQAFSVLVDCARTEGELRQALSMLRALTPGRLLVVFGCGGNRERSSRSRVTTTVQEFSDFAIATADNPRTEAMAQIFGDMRAGVTAPGNLTWIDDRRRAIGLALDLARTGDCVLLAGKGHETCQELADTVFPFDDRQVARELIEDKMLRRQT